MSFSFGGDFQDLASAKAYVEALDGSQNPRSIKDFVHAALDGLAEIHGLVGSEQPIDGVRIRATGHLCKGKGSYELTSAQVEVSPIRFIKQG